MLVQGGNRLVGIQVDMVCFGPRNASRGHINYLSI